MSDESTTEPIDEKVGTYGAETPVTGQTKCKRLGQPTLKMRKLRLSCITSQGQIFEQIYTPWEGTLNQDG